MRLAQVVHAVDVVVRHVLQAQRRVERLRQAVDVERLLLQLDDARVDDARAVRALALHLQVDELVLRVRAEHLRHAEVEQVGERVVLR